MHFHGQAECEARRVREVLLGISSVLSKQQIMPMLLQACPSFVDSWNELRDEHGPELDELVYVSLGAYARHLVALLEQQRSAEFLNVFQVIEELHVHGDADVREAATIGLLEGIQNALSHAGADQSAVESYLLPESARWWRSLNKFWAGEIRFVGEDLKS
jgi:hypothetical protein